jgi:hypothetical protein
MVLLRSGWESEFDLLEMKRLEATLPVVPNVSH